MTGNPTTASPSASLPQRSIAIVGGGTAGHVYPALAIADAYRAAVPNVRIVFIGTHHGFEGRLVPSRGYRLELIPGAPLFGVGVLGRGRALWQVLTGMVAARRVLRASGAQLVIGLGGYATAGTMLAARSLGLRTAIHESNAAPGLANRWLGHLVDRVYLGFAAAAAAFPAGRVLVTGVPTSPMPVEEPAARQPPAGRALHVLVTGGSQGSAFLNRRLPDLLGRVIGGGISMEVQHQTGDADVGLVCQAYDRLGIAAAVLPYIEPMVEAYQWADFAVTCAGAVTLAELAVNALPALVVPLATAAEDHQAANARAFAAETGCPYVREADWQTEALATVLVALFKDTARLRLMSQQCHRMAKPNAAQIVVAESEALLSRRP